MLPGAALVTDHQIHSPDVVTVTAPWADDSRPQADALVTNRPGLLLGILTADCAPVLLADAQAGVIGAAHAGWKGALAGVCEATVAAMEALGAHRTRIAAAIGPCIAQASYEVDAAFEARFLATDSEPLTRSCRAKSRHAPQRQRVSTADKRSAVHPEPAEGLDTSGVSENAQFFKPGREGHAQFDLESFVASRLAAAGLTTIEKLALDTYTDESRFYSYRRATHCGEPGYGREIAVIGL